MPLEVQKYVKWMQQIGSWNFPACGFFQTHCIQCLKQSRFSPHRRPGGGGGGGGGGKRACTGARDAASRVLQAAWS